VQAPLEEVLLAGEPCLPDVLARVAGTLPREQPLDGADGRVERGDRRTVLGPAVPPAVGEPAGEERADDRFGVLAEIRRRPERDTVDAGLDLAREVRLTRVLPAHVLPDERDRAAGLRCGRVQPEVDELLQREVRGRPG